MVSYEVFWTVVAALALLIAWVWTRADSQISKLTLRVIDNQLEEIQASAVTSQAVSELHKQLTALENKEHSQ